MAGDPIYGRCVVCNSQHAPKGQLLCPECGGIANRLQDALGGPRTNEMIAEALRAMVKSLEAVENLLERILERVATVDRKETGEEEK